MILIENDTNLNREVLMSNYFEVLSSNCAIQILLFLACCTQIRSFSPPHRNVTKTHTFNYTFFKGSGRPIHHVRSSKHYREYNKEEESKLTQIFLYVISGWLPCYTASQPICWHQQWPCVFKWKLHPMVCLCKSCSVTSKCLSY